MQKPTNYDTTQAAGEFEPIKLGGHKMVIKQVSERQSQGGLNMIVKGNLERDYKSVHSGRNCVIIRRA